MRIILVGQAAFAERVLGGLLDNGHEVAAVYCPPDRPGASHDPVKVRATDLGIAVCQHKSLKGPEVQKEFESIGADLGVLAYVTQIVPRNVFEVPCLGSICFHPSILPRYRGGSAINWQIIRGETETGVSVFWVDAGIDTGPILLQRRASIDPDDTAGSLYYKTLFPLGVDAVVEAVELVAAGKAPRQPQDDAAGTYDALCRDEHAGIDWSRPVAEVYNLIRGCDPQPGAYTEFKGKKLRFYDCRMVSGAGFRAGVVADTSTGILIGAGGGGVRAQRVRFDGAKVPASEFAAEHSLQEGTVLGG